MASMTLTLTVDNLNNEELDQVEKKLWEFLRNNKNVPIGKVVDVSELEREEDEEEVED